MKFKLEASCNTAFCKCFVCHDAFVVQSAVLVREQGEQSLHEAQELQAELAEQSRAIQVQRVELREREKQLAMVSWSNSNTEVCQC